MIVTSSITCLEEVLQRQPDRVQAFLLQTCILGLLSGPLCDAVTGQGGGKAMLEALDRGNLFLVPLDDRRQWYRYHHLFADVLQARLLDEHPDQVPGLHLRASVWFQRNGEQSVAIGHALAGEDFHRAADLIEQAVTAMSQARQEATVRGWLELIPDEVTRVRPVLMSPGPGSCCRSASSVMSRTGCRTPSGGRTRREQAGTGSCPGRDDRGQRGGIPAPAGDDRNLPGRPGARPGRAAGRHQVCPAAVPLARPASIAGALRRRASWLIAFWGSGDLEGAYSARAECVAGLRRAGHIADIFGCMIAMADIRLVQGRLGAAMRTYEQALQVLITRAGRSCGNGRHVRGDERGLA